MTLRRKLALFLCPALGDDMRRMRREAQRLRDELAEVTGIAAAYERNCNSPMSAEQAMRVIEDAKRWNTGQKSCSLAFGGPREQEDDLYDLRRLALKQAWSALCGLRSRNGGAS